MNTDWAKDIALADLPEIYQAVAEVVGLENAISLSELLSGQLVYFPKLDSLLRIRRDSAIRREFTGRNHRDLARKFGLTEQRIRNILRDGHNPCNRSMS